MKVWETDGRYVNPRDPNECSTHPKDAQIDFEEIVDKAWPEPIMFWCRPFSRSIAISERHDTAPSWQCGSTCPKSRDLWCRRERHHRGKCSDIMTRADLAKVTGRVHLDKSRDATKRYSVKQLREILGEDL